MYINASIYKIYAVIYLFIYFLDLGQYGLKGENMRDENRNHSYTQNTSPESLL